MTIPACTCHTTKSSKPGHDPLCPVTLSKAEPSVPNWTDNLAPRPKQTPGDVNTETAAKVARKEAMDRWDKGPKVDPRRGARLRDTSTGRVGVFSGEIFTSAPPWYGVAWEDGTYGKLWAPYAEVIDE